MDTLNTDATHTLYRVSFSFLGNVDSTNPQMPLHKLHLAALDVVGTAYSHGQDKYLAEQAVQYLAQGGIQ